MDENEMGVDETQTQMNKGMDRPKWDIVCATCGKNATVPFQPIPGRKTYCFDCYKAYKEEHGGFQKKPYNNYSRNTQYNGPKKTGFNSYRKPNPKNEGYSY